MKTVDIKVEHKHHCVDCDKDFSQKSSLNLHIKRIHEGVKIKEHKYSFPCTLCPHIAPRKSQLKLHMYSAHLNLKHKCNKCDKEFSAPFTLRKHVENVHQGVKHQCNICGSQYGMKASLEKHKTVHKKQSLPTLNINWKPVYTCFFQ